MAPPLLSAMLAVAPHLVIQMNDRAVRLAVQGRDESMLRCIEAGLELEFRFEVETCRKRSLWFDSCGGVKEQITTLRYEPVSDIYIVWRDIIGDKEKPWATRFMSAEDGLAESSVSHPADFRFLADGDERLEAGDRRYVRARASTRCKEERDQILDRVTEGLTFGLVKPDHFDSGWKEKKFQEGTDQEKRG